MVQWQKPNTGRVKLKKSTGAFCPQLTFGGKGKNLEAVYYLCCYVNSEKGDGGIKNKIANSPLSAAGMSVKTFQVLVQLEMFGSG